MKKFALVAVLVCFAPMASAASPGAASFDVWGWLQSLFESSATASASPTTTTTNVGNSIVDDLNGLIR